ncbi:MAG: ABC transporter ATP-binding protein, partial [Chloroflexi bacterium]|nr:ABC transporter ATP-binding protein [Chloroflexota bacterium]
SYTMNSGEILGIVGESGCGKSVHALSMMQLIPDPPGKITNGEIWFDGRNLLELDEEQMQKVRGRDIAMIFQDPMTSLNPVFTVGFQIVEALLLHNDLTKVQANARAGELLDLVGIPAATQRLNDYPHQFSGGMRQRAMIAMGLSCEPKLLIADEPTTALDVTIQAQIIDLVKKLQDELGMAIMWITHDLGVVAELAHIINVMYAGSIIESGKIRNIYKKTRHPYTIGLLGSLPRLDDAPGTELISIPGLPPDLLALPEGCPFAARCDYRVEQCLAENPPLVEIDGPDHSVACWRWEVIAGIESK